MNLRLKFSLVAGPALICVLLAPKLIGATVEGDFDTANKFYEQGKFSDAAALYEKSIQSGKVSSALYFNFGNALFKSSQIGRAIAAYREAEKLSPRDPDVRANLQFARAQIQGPTLPPSRWQSWLGELTLDEWAVFAAIPFWLCLVALSLMQIQPRWKPTLRSFAFATGSTTFVIAACLCAALVARSDKLAIVMVRDAAVRNGPLDEAQVRFTAHDGAELQVLDSKDNWLQISASGQQEGWLKREQVVVLPKVF